MLLLSVMMMMMMLHGGLIASSATLPIRPKHREGETVWGSTVSSVPVVMG